MCNYEQRVFQHEGFQLEVTPIIIKPSEEDFHQAAPGLAIQCGADFHLSYQGRFSSEPKLGILQFVRSDTVVGNPPKDPVSGVCIDSGFQATGRLVDYLYGSPEGKIIHQMSAFFGKYTAIREKNRCEIYDIPREVHGFAGQNLQGSPIMIEFWEFAVEIDGEYGIIYPGGIKWSMAFAQEAAGENAYSCKVGFGASKFTDLNYKGVFGNQNAVRGDTYKIASSH